MRSLTGRTFRQLGHESGRSTSTHKRVLNSTEESIPIAIKELLVGGISKTVVAPLERAKILVQEAYDL
ncbi:hypothetical protein KSP40_PGU011608 [Platanthera guangdongensis]|uniref:Uncharacterized protein n=1 Tax=Platanthera guangdongensis TaxID=2320717 RepID=A0ABR2M9A8_9ASPA